MPNIDIIEMSHLANEAERRHLAGYSRAMSPRDETLMHGDPFQVDPRLIYRPEESLMDIVREQRRRYPPWWRKLWNWMRKVPDYARIAELERELGLGNK